MTQEINFSNLSKEVGWNYRKVEWPKTTKEIDKATPYEILEWYRFLPSPENTKQTQVIEKVVQKVRELINNGSKRTF